MHLRDKRRCEDMGWIFLSSIYETVRGCCEYSIETSVSTTGMDFWAS
jgi:hypothetical protein